MAKHTVEQYRDFAYRALVDIVDLEGAVVWDEVEAKVSERQWRDIPCRVNPHHLTTARHRAGPEGDNLIFEDHAPSKGGHLITTLQPVDQAQRQNEVTQAARRKRALQSRYVAWTQGNMGERARVGVAGENVFHASLLAAAPYGYAPIRPEGGDVRTLFDTEVPGGPLDSAAWLTVPGESRRPRSYLVLVEVKNLRSWIYPPAHELYQLLDKAATLQQQEPDLEIVPLLVARRSHVLTGRMAKQLGFVVLDMDVQPIVWHDDDTRLLDEVRLELGYDLLPVPADRHAAPSLDRLVGGLRHVLPEVAARTSQQWAGIGSNLGDHYKAIRAAPVASGRAPLVDELREAAKELGDPGGW